MPPVRRSLAALVFGACLFASPAAQAEPSPALLDPSLANEQAPASYRAKFDTTKGAILFECTREWAPYGADRFYNLVKIGFFDNVAFFRVVKGFVTQWGIHGDPAVAKAWEKARLAPDPVKESNQRGTLTFAMAGRPDTRTTQVFLNFGNNARLDGMGFAPLCKVVEGMDVADALFAEYGEQVTSKQGEITAKGNAYLKDAWPNLDYVKSATIVGGGGAPTPAPSTPASEGSGSAMYVVGALLVLGIGVLLVTGRGGPAPAHAPAAPAKGPARSAKKPGADRGKRAGASRAKPSATKSGPAKPSAE
jgi:peptidyl-prolyl cis-trans isomerase A (cyclophilin A)